MGVRLYRIAYPIDVDVNDLYADCVKPEPDARYEFTDWPNRPTISPVLVTWSCWGVDPWKTNPEPKNGPDGYAWCPSCATWVPSWRQHLEVKHERG
jgi:hypothetical protein